MMNLMLTRAKYFKKNYIFMILSIVPLLVITILSIYVQNEKSDIDTLERQPPQVISTSYSLIDYNRTYNNISKYLSGTYGAIIADDDECESINNFYKSIYIQEIAGYSEA